MPLKKTKYQPEFCVIKWKAKYARKSTFDSNKNETKFLSFQLKRKGYFYRLMAIYLLSSAFIKIFVFLLLQSPKKLPKLVI